MIAAYSAGLDEESPCADKDIVPKRRAISKRIRL